MQPQKDMSTNVWIQERYKVALRRMIKLNFPDLTNYEINKALDYSITKRYQQEPAVIYNNYSEKTVNILLSELTDYIYQKQPILTAWGVMFKRHDATINPLTKLIYMFMTNRDKFKKIRNSFIKGSEDFNSYDMLQLLAKVDTNAIYGALGNTSCVLYNLHVAASITFQGRSYISAAIMFFEMFLSNNVKFGSLEEIITYIDNIRTEERHYDDKDILDNDVNEMEVLNKIILTCGDFRHGKIKWIPSQRDLDIIYEQLCNCSQEDLNRIYYKNNLYDFLDNSVMTRALIYLLKGMRVPYLDPNMVPEEISVEMDTFCDLLREYVFYNHQIIDRIDRNTNMAKNVSLISDTDSTIVCFDRFYHYVLDKVKGIPLEINKVFVKGMEYVQNDWQGNPELERAMMYQDPDYDYDFYNEKVIEIERSINPEVVIPQDNLRYSIINIIGHCCGILCNEYIESHTKAGNSYEEGRKTLMYLKNEFTFKRVLLTNVKKNYASKVEVQEGNMVPEEESLDIKGLAIKKSSLNKETRDELCRILYEDILKPDTIDQVKVIKDLAIFENNIFESLRNGEKKFYKPSSFKAMSKYDDPLGIQGVKASLIWNEVRDPNLEAIDLTAKNNVDIVKVIINSSTLNLIKDDYPEEYDRLNELLTGTSDLSATLKGNIDAIAIPRDVETPKWITYLIDYTKIMNDNIKNFPVESIGINRMNKTNVNYSNILKL